MLSNKSNNSTQNSHIRKFATSGMYDSMQTNFSDSAKEIFNTKPSYFQDYVKEHKLKKVSL